MSTKVKSEFLDTELLIITGMSGAGRSVAADALEDQGWYIVDNLPPQMFKMFVSIIIDGNFPMKKVALGVDVRSKAVFSDLIFILETLHISEISYKVLFMDCSDEVLIRRFQQARRPHPLQGNGRISSGIVSEREFVEAVREKADLLIDTSNTNIHELARMIADIFVDNIARILKINIVSFGFKYGTPQDANYIADVRFIANPYWVPSLRDLSGLDVAVSDYVLGQSGVAEFLDNYTRTLMPVFAGYLRESKYYTTLAIGCTGGHHRSVAISEKLAILLADMADLRITVSHRDLSR